jgi:hypothetical protein
MDAGENDEEGVLRVSEDGASDEGADLVGACEEGGEGKGDS